MKNITLSIEAETLAAVRRYAVERDASVNSLVREYLTGIAQRHGRARQSRKRIRELSEESDARLGPKTWTRDELHEG